MENKLFEICKEYVNHLKKENIFLGEKFSNPYFISVPDDWNENGILIVGEEGYGDWGCGKKYGWEEKPNSAWMLIESNNASESTIKNIQAYNRGYLRLNTNATAPICENGMHYGERNSSPFWRKISEIKGFLPNGTPIAWSNIDKIHYLGKICALSKKDRKELHKPEMPRILRAEIEILKPKIIIFLGYYWESLNHELPEICESLYPDKCAWNKSNGFKRIFETSDKDARHYIFCYHPCARLKKELRERMNFDLRNIIAQAVTWGDI